MDDIFTSLEDALWELRQNDAMDGMENDGLKAEHFQMAREKLSKLYDENGNEIPLWKLEKMRREGAEVFAKKYFDGPVLMRWDGLMIGNPK